MILLTTMVLLLVLGDAEVAVVTVVGVRDVSVWWITTGPHPPYNRLDRQEEIPEQRISFYSNTATDLYRRPTMCGFDIFRFDLIRFPIASIDSSCLLIYIYILYIG